MKKFVTFLAVCSVFTVPTFANNSTVIYDSSGNPQSGADRLVDQGPLGFTFTSPGSASNLAVVKLMLVNSAPQQPAVRKGAARVANQLTDGTIQVNLYSNNPVGPQPASFVAQIGTMPDSNLTNTPTLYTFVPVSTISLTPNTRYWVVVRVAGTTSNASLEFSTTSSGTNVATEYLGYNLFSQFQFTGTPNNAEQSYNALVGVNPTTPPVPLPPSVTLTLVGFLCGGLYFAQRKFRDHSSLS